MSLALKLFTEISSIQLGDNNSNTAFQSRYQFQLIWLFCKINDIMWFLWWTIIPSDGPGSFVMYLQCGGLLVQQGTVTPLHSLVFNPTKTNNNNNTDRVKTGDVSDVLDFSPLTLLLRCLDCDTSHGVLSASQRENKLHQLAPSFT